jgi:hypothetical protein
MYSEENRRHYPWRLTFAEYNGIHEGKWYWGYFRRMRTVQERRYAADPEHKPYIRGKRSIRNLPDSWQDEVTVTREKSWKARYKKRKRYMVNKKKRDG